MKAHSSQIPTPTAARLASVHARMAAACERVGRDPATVSLVAVAKTATAESLQEAWAAGQRRFGHNRVEALQAHRAVLPEAEWHLLGPLQGRKVRRALALAEVIQAVGELKTVQRLARRLEEDGGVPPRLLLQVNLAPADGRYGCPLEDLPTFFSALQREAPQLPVVGLMTIAPLAANEAEVRQGFRRLAAVFHDWSAQGRFGAEACLSMGMSGDFETAIEEGATLVRVGRAIFPVTAEEAP